LLDGQGVIRAKGLVNTREHLESLLEAKAMNVASLQAYLKETRVQDEEDSHRHSGEAAQRSSAGG